MPIKPENMKLYPGGSIRSPEWQEIREMVGARSGWKCESCGAAHKAMVLRGTLGDEPVYMTETKAVHEEDTGEFLGRFTIGQIENGKWVRIILTVAHLDGDVTNSDMSNLKHWCQLHHNRHDAPMRRNNRAQTYKMKYRGQLIDEDSEQ